MYLTGLATAVPPRRFKQTECWAALQHAPQFPQLSARSHALLRQVLSGENGIAIRHLAVANFEEAFVLTPNALHARFAEHAPSPLPDSRPRRWTPPPPASLPQRGRAGCSNTHRGRPTPNAGRFTSFYGIWAVPREIWHRPDVHVPPGSHVFAVVADAGHFRLCDGFVPGRERRRVGSDDQMARSCGGKSSTQLLEPNSFET